MFRKNGFGDRKDGDIQKTVNRTVNDGLKIIQVLLKDARAKHAAADDSEADVACVLSSVECNHKYRKEDRECFYKCNLKIVLRDDQKRNKEGDSPKETRT